MAGGAARALRRELVREPAAGEWLVGLWSRGQRERADELAAETLGERLDLAELAAEFA